MIFRYLLAVMSILYSPSPSPSPSVLNLAFGTKLYEVE